MSTSGLYTHVHVYSYIHVSIYTQAHIPIHTPHIYTCKKKRKMTVERSAEAPRKKSGNR